MAERTFSRPTDMSAVDGGASIGFIMAWRVLADNRMDYGGDMPTDEQIKAVLDRNGMADAIGYLFDTMQDTLADAGLLTRDPNPFADEG